MQNSANPVLGHDDRSAVTTTLRFRNSVESPSLQQSSLNICWSDFWTVTLHARRATHQNKWQDLNLWPLDPGVMIKRAKLWSHWENWEHVNSRLNDDGEDISEASRLTAKQKVSFLDRMPGKLPIIVPTSHGENVHLNPVYLVYYQTAFRISDNRCPVYQLCHNPLGSPLKVRRSVPEVGGFCGGRIVQS